MLLILWILAAILVVSGIIAMTKRQMVYGIVLVLVGFAVGPGGVSVFA